MIPILSVRDLTIAHKKPVVERFSFDIYKQEFVALVGQSGVGKSIIAHALVGLLDETLHIKTGHIYYEGQDITHYSTTEWTHFRKQYVSLMIQQSLSALDPLHTVEQQLMHTLKFATTLRKKQRKERAVALLEAAGFDEPHIILKSYPHELSGGMCQRVLLAIILSTKPSVLIVDEPTTALDMLNQQRVLSLLKTLQQTHQLTILLISHDQQSVDKYADRVIHFMKEGVLC